MNVDLWEQKADENVEKWGHQSLEDLHVASSEEFLELNHALMHYRYDDPDGEEDASLDDIRAEVDDLAALLIQIRWALADVEGDDDEEEDDRWGCPQHDEFYARCDYCSSEHRRRQTCDVEGCDESSKVTVGASHSEYDHLCYSHYTGRSDGTADYHDDDG